MKKYIHEIKITFTHPGADTVDQADINLICEQVCTKEAHYLNPAYIGKQQVMDLLVKLHKLHMDELGIR